MYETIREGDYGLEYTRSLMPLLDRGFILAFTHRRPPTPATNTDTIQPEELKKHVAVDDLLRCVQHLLRESYTSAAKLAVLVRAV